MKKIITLITILILGVVTMNAQEFGGPMGQPPMDELTFNEDSTQSSELAADAKNYAKHMTDALNEKATLSEEQWNSVYKIYKNEMQARINAEALASANSDPMSMMSGNSAPQRNTSSDTEKRIIRRNKKLVKILDETQYNIYLEMQKNGEID